VIPELQAALFQAVQAGDLPRARAINDRIYPLAQAFYAAPALDMHNRMKECLVMLGRMDRAVVRPPLVRIGDAERARLHAALDAAGIRGEGGFELAA
jgi:4-hydroxy-tetrahydrodipicolinate synthase